MGDRKAVPDESSLFRAAMHDVRPLRVRRARAPYLVPAGGESRPAAVRPKAAGTGPAPATEPRPLRPNPGIDRKTVERLRKGEITIDRRIDLHGMTQRDAHAALDRFVRKAWEDGKRMLLVITGKGSIGAGGGVLRRHMPRWLGSGEHAARVLRVESAQPRHGGSGAFYVLLRRRREPA